MPTVEWVKLEERTQVTCGIISVFTNAFLMYLILAKSPSKLGSYKWLMLYTSTFELFYAFVNLFAGPSVHTYGSAFIVFQDMRNFYFSHQTAQILVCLYCSCFGFSMAIFGGHFIYRYGAIDIEFRQKYLSGSKQALLYICPFFYGIFWGVICWLYYGETPERTEYLRDTMLENYRLNISECAYISAHFWPYDEHRNVFPDGDSWLGIGVMWIILGSSMISVTYFAIRCYRWLTQKLKHMESISESMKSLQKQLFNALMIQTAIPLFLMYLPASMVFVFPMLNTELNLKYPFIGITIAIYPAIDPLPTMLIIKSYRRGICEVFRKLTCRRRKQIDVSNIQSHGLAATAMSGNISVNLTN
uniref:Serpentine receptor class r-10 n=1 Tax=Caenorhabditis tropicalis TaxID=1561998 RepID=A0A1I7U9F7_9PELO